MAQAATVVVNDRQATPVAHSYVPRGGPPGKYSFVETNSVPMGEKTLTVAHRKSNGRHYVRVTLMVPVLVTETINGVSVPKVPRNAFIDCTFRFDETSSLQERKDAVGMFANALAPTQTVIDPTITGLEGVPF